MPDAPYIASGLPIKVVETDGETNLFRYAAREMGNALFAWQIAEVNGLSDYWPPAGVLLKIPPPAASAQDGLPGQ